MKNTRKPKIIVITGAESTGKSVLTRQLGNFFSAPFFPEYAREYLEMTSRPYIQEDVDKIARVQLAQMEEALSLETDYVFFDTWLIITKVWMEVVYGKVPDWIPDAIARTPIDLFLLCDTDISWEPDPLRENGGEIREWLSQTYQTNLRHFRFKYRIVSGAGNKRFENALQIIKQTC